MNVRVDTIALEHLPATIGTAVALTLPCNRTLTLAALSSALLPHCSPLFLFVSPSFLQVIKGWDIGMASMLKGEKAIFTIAPDHAYGSQDVGDGLIPANSTLVFEVELINSQ
jgi:hypothetical protein